MDSINKEQIEDNYKDLKGTAALEKLKELKDKSCFFCTLMKAGAPFNTRPMAVQQVDDSGKFWFLSATDSHKNAEIASDPTVQLLFQGASYSEFITLYGRAEISLSMEKIKELWSPLLKTWFTGGIDDPRISAICVTPSEGYYWDTKHGQLVAFAKQVAGSIIGKTMDDSIEGTLSV